MDGMEGGVRLLVFSLGRKAIQAPGQTRGVGQRAGDGCQKARERGEVSCHTFKVILEDSE